MDYIFWIGVIGSLILVTGAAWPNPKTAQHPARSIKNWLFAIGSTTLFLYSILNYIDGGPIFFVLLQILVFISILLMMLNSNDKVDVPIIAVSSLALIIWSFFIFESFNTIIFVVGLCGIGLGYAFQTGSTRRDLALTLGSILIALFSHLEASWIFFWLNVFFAIFSGYYLVKGLKKSDGNFNKIS